MQIFKKLLKNYILSAIIIITLITGISLAQDFYYDNPNWLEPDTTITTTDLWKIIKKDSVSNWDVAKQDSLLYKIREYFKLTWSDTYEWENQKAPATAYIKMILNILLWLVSFISLILVIFAFYLIFAEKWEEWVKKAKKILSSVAIAIILIWLSRIIVNALFTLYSTTAIQNV